LDPFLWYPKGKYHVDLLSSALVPIVTPPKAGAPYPSVFLTVTLLPDVPPFQFSPEVPGTTSPVAILPCAYVLGLPSPEYQKLAVGVPSLYTYVTFGSYLNAALKGVGLNCPGVLSM